MQTLDTLSVCPFNSCNYYPSSIYQTLIVLSLLPDIIFLPSVEIQILIIELV